MSDTRPCHELPRQALVERVARAMREPELLADPRIPPGRCALCLETLSSSHLVVDRRDGRVRTWQADTGSAEAAMAEGLREVDGVWVTRLKLCPCAARTEIQEEAERHNRERLRPKPASAASADTGFSGGARY